jgi:hypothetical protein
MRRAALLPLVAALGGCSSEEKKEEPLPPTTRAPAPSASAPQAAGDGVVVGLKKVLAGDTDERLEPDPDAWSRYGLDIDGLISDVGDARTCLPVGHPNGFPEFSQPDGPGGVDNSFGRNVISLLEDVAPDASASITSSIERGEVTFMLHLVNYDPDLDDQNGIQARLYAGAPRVPEDYDGGIFVDAGPEDAGIDAGPPCPACQPPRWDGTDEWRAVYETVQNGDIEKPNVSFDQSYVVGGKFVSAPTRDLSLSVPVRGFVLQLLVHQAVIVGDVTGSGADLVVKNGIISGILDREEVIESLRAAAGATDVNLCGPVGLLAQPIRWRADIMLNGSHDPSQECNAISIGLGFEGRPILLAGLAPPAPPPAGACPEK